MKNVSLFKVTAMVITVAFASSFVNAEDKVIEKSQADAIGSAKQPTFSTLIEKLDTDKNGMLSQAEVSANKNQLLHKEFNKMDANQDQQIDEAEFNNYLAKVKNKTADLAKSTL
ncbi:MAG: hypothetical protein OQK09_13015 [Colwellia sp.]|nr:hypothetical protein [Colwellia sp.]MCW8864288.1 hypothetical protein [Colwellia sp.]MCW9082427.1 hypothetical protein [Colwellia sp.]